MDVCELTCPACGAALDADVPRNGKIKCSYCGTVLIIKSTAPKSNAPVDILDDKDSRRIAGALLPGDWVFGGSLVYSAQALSNAYTVSVRAASGDGACSVFAYGPACYRQINRDFANPHIEGSFNRQMMMPIKKFVPAEEYLERTAKEMLNPLGGGTFIEQRELPKQFDFERLLAEEIKQGQAMLDAAAVSVGRAIMGDGYYNGCTRIYSYTLEGVPMRLTLCCSIEAYEFSIHTGIGAVAGGDILGSLSSAFGGSSEGGVLKKIFDFGMSGGLLGHQNSVAQQPQANTPAPSPGAFTGEAKNGGMTSYCDWTAQFLMGFICPEELFEDTYKIFEEFFCSFSLDERIKRMNEEEAANITRRMQQAQQQQFQQWQQIHAAQTAAFDSYNKAWWDRTASADASRRSAYQSRMAAEDRMSDRYSEAVRGVNTYVRPDGSEVEVSVAADKAYMHRNDSTHVVGGTAGSEGGPDYIELEKKW